MRVLTACVLVLIATALGCVQAVSAIALRGSAQPGSWVRLVPESVARRVERVDPAWPMPQTLLAVLARRALAEGDLAQATADLAHLDPSPDKLALEGQLREARGDETGAAQAYLGAGDLEDLQRRIGELRRSWHTPEAVALERALVDRLQGDPTQRDTLAQALYDLGTLEEAQAYRFALDDPARALHERRAGEAYAQAVALAPVEERYLLAYGNQLLNLGRLDEARATFGRAHDVDPANPEPFAGLGEIALRRGDRPQALAQYARARRLNPGDRAVVRLARELGV